MMLPGLRLPRRVKEPRGKDLDSAVTCGKRKGICTLIILPRLQAVAFQCELPSGSTHPCVFVCEDEEGNEAVEYVVKFRSEVRGGATGLLFEFIAAQLADSLDVPMPAPALIELDAQLADATPERSVAERIRASIGLNFGTRFLTPGYVTWRVNDEIPLTLRQTATDILAFDAVIDNADRRRDKPNLLWKGDELFVFDHEVAFAFTRLIGTHIPFEDTGMQFLREHPLYAGMRGQPIDLRRFTGELEGLTDSVISSICNRVPSEFGTMYLDSIQHWLTQARDRAQYLAGALGRILQ